MRTGPKEKTLEERFYYRVMPEPNSGCWLWTGAVGNSGYGHMFAGGSDRREIGAHRASYQIHCEAIPDGVQVLHKCDNKLCVNPEHLFLGTQSDNLYDMARKGRYVGNRRLKKEQVIDIRSRVSKGERRVLIANQFGVSLAAVNMIASRKRWATV